MAVVLGGYGQPEESPLVTGGLGLAGAPPAGAMRATLRGASDLAGVLTNGTVPEPPASGAPGRWMPPVTVLLPQPRPAVPGHLAATLAGSSRLTAEPTFRIDPDALLAELAAALLLDLV